MSFNRTIPNLSASATLHPEPFTISISDSDVAGLKQLLKLTPKHLSTFENETTTPHHVRTFKEGEKYFGLGKKWMEEMREKWEGFDWRSQESYINSFPQYIVEVPSESPTSLPVSSPSAPIFPAPPTLSLHFVAHISPSQNTIPIVLVHGWPGSFVEFLSVFEILKNSKVKGPDGTEWDFSIIIPSNPGYTFSQKPPKDRDLPLVEVAGLIDRLMVGLGFGTDSKAGGYFAQGGDIGSLVSRLLGAHFPACLGAHLNMLTIHPMRHPDLFANPRYPSGVLDFQGGLPEGWESDVNLKSEIGLEGDHEVALVEKLRLWRTPYMTAYFQEHATRPSTVGMAIESSPVALLAWVGEKLVEWTDPSQPPISSDQILTIISLWWFTQTYPSSIYTYRELGGRNPNLLPEIKRKGFGFSNFKWELGPLPKKWAEKEGDMAWYKYHEKGGHFPAMEVPQVLAQDITSFVETMISRAP